MKVHPNKTHLLCIAAAAGYDVSAFIRVDGEEYRSKNELKILGYIFGNKPGVDAHVRKIKKGFIGLAWTIRNLKRAKVPQKVITKVYCSVIRSTIEYASVVYGCLLTSEQLTDIERLQATSLGIIWGWNRPYKELLQLAGLETLEKRRIKAFEKFSLKAVASERFRERWFPLRPADMHGIRNRRPYLEVILKHERLLKSPIYKMRKVLNDIYVGCKEKIKDPRLAE